MEVFVIYTRITIVWLLVVFIPLATFLILEPIPQPLDYYSFADDRAILGISNFWNVVTNLPFLLVGVWGVLLDGQNRLVHDNPPGFPAYRWFFIGVSLTAFGSAWFHLEPNAATLLWDRLPITIAFMALVTGLFSEHLNSSLSKWLLYPLLITGLVSVLYWYVTELAGKGDLRPYLLVQFLPMIILPLVVLGFPSRFSRGADLLWVLLLYGLAKVAELYDRTLYDALGGFSGHSFKHLLAAAGSALFLRMLMLRRARQGL